MRYVQIAGLLMASVAAACGATESEELDKGAGQHSKELTISDESGESVVFIKLTSSDLAALAAYGEDSFTLSPFAQEQAAEPEPAVPAEHAAPAAGSAPNAFEEALGVSVEILGEELATGMVGYHLTDNTQVNYRDPFTIVYRETSNDCAVVSRVSTFNSVYVTMETQPTNGSMWSVFSGRTEVRRNFPIEGCDFGSFKVRARVARRNANDYSFTSHN